MKLNILAIGAHPDDVELGCGGTLLLQKSLGNSIGILDLTAGELGTRGSGELRLKESEEAKLILGLDVRENLEFKDGFFRNDEEHQKVIIQKLRKYKPDIVLANAPSDRHPDHGRASQLVYDSCFLSGLPKVKTNVNGEDQEAWRPSALYHYVQFKHIEPDFVVDITKFYDQKMKSVMAYKSQFFDPDSNEPNTFISSKGFLEFIDSKLITFAKPIGAKYAEGFLTNRYIGVKDLMHLT